MKIRFTKSVLSEALKPLLNTVSVKSSTASGESVLIQAYDDDRVVMTTFDNDKGTQTVVEAEVQEPGAYMINAMKLDQIVRVCDDVEVLVQVDSSLGVQIESGRAQTKMIANSADDFATIPDLSGDSGFEVAQSVFKKMLQKVHFAIGVNDQRTILNGCLVEIEDNKMLVVASDGFRIARCETEVDITNIGNEQKFKFIVPGKSVNELIKLLSDESEENARVYMNKKFMIVVVGKFTFFTKLIEGEYLDFDRIIVKNHKIKVRVNKYEMLNALERAALVTEEKFIGQSHVKITIEDQIIKVTAMSTISSLYDEVECEHEGEDLFISFNNRFLIECVRACDAENILLSLNSSFSAMNITPDDEDSDNDVYMVLPIKIAG